MTRSPLLKGMPIESDEPTWARIIRWPIWVLLIGGLLFVLVKYVKWVWFF
jgi:hypothetical protein